MKAYVIAFACLALAGCGTKTEIERLEFESEQLSDRISGYRSSICTLERQKARVDRKIEIFDRSQILEEGVSR